MTSWKDIFKDPEKLKSILDTLFKYRVTVLVTLFVGVSVYLGYRATDFLMGEFGNRDKRIIKLEEKLEKCNNNFIRFKDSTSYIQYKKDSVIKESQKRIIEKQEKILNTQESLKKQLK